MADRCSESFILCRAVQAKLNSIPTSSGGGWLDRFSKTSTVVECELAVVGLFPLGKDCIIAQALPCSPDLPSALSIADCGAPCMQALPYSVTLSILLLACWQLREAVSPLDIVRWSLDGELPYLTFGADEHALLDPHTRSIVSHAFLMPAGREGCLALNCHAFPLPTPFVAACLQGSQGRLKSMQPPRSSLAACIWTVRPSTSACG